MNLLKVIFLLSIASVTTHSNAGIPTIDATNLVQAILQVTNAVKQVNSLVEQVNTAKDQLSTASDTLNSMKGARGMGGVLSSAYDPSMAVNTNSILSSNGLSNASTLGVAGATGALYDAANNLSAKYLGQTGKTLQQSQTRFSEIMKLVAKVNNAPEQKDILDLQARIGAESAMLQNEIIKLAALRAQNEANATMMQRKREQMHLQFSGTSNDLHL
ncbi:Minor pilin of type IV secretion complex, VirB5 [Bathymodiolus heckerae thiotrophic gill symbiont]|uniref:type IV secretion system protein n=1 Tax=Bathymodiolus heckerae thiotrophic gill symbiont TaxID=1052212 RepID=UPI0010BA3FDB|nr:type IV secretion system protein [Bathymodiolus heckerae thiotrophic gill symbiont]SHN91352.1 Minor pilin of type IV secretion complex, VirB5 [Bathymodiolus heckerae thiotrophic gill symbiont]